MEQMHKMHPTSDRKSTKARSRIDLKAIYYQSKIDANLVRRGSMEVHGRTVAPHDPSGLISVPFLAQLGGMLVGAMFTKILFVEEGGVGKR